MAAEVTLTGRHPASRTRATWSARPPQVGVVDGAFGRGERGGAYLDDQAPPAPRTGPSRRMRSRRHRSSLLERVGRRSARLERERAAQDAYLVAVPRARALERLVHPQGASGGAAKTARPPRSPSRSAPPCAPPADPPRKTRRRKRAHLEALVARLAPKLPHVLVARVGLRRLAGLLAQIAHLAGDGRLQAVHALARERAHAVKPRVHRAWGELVAPAAATESARTRSASRSHASSVPGTSILLATTMRGRRASSSAYSASSG